jgi:hypothetical protein
MLERAFSAKIDIIIVYLRNSQSPQAGKLLLSSLYTGSHFKVPKFPKTMPDNRRPLVKDGTKRPPVTATTKNYKLVRKHFFDCVTNAVARGCNEVRRVGGSARHAVWSHETMEFLRQQRGALPRARFAVSSCCVFLCCLSYCRSLTHTVHVIYENIG